MVMVVPGAGRRYERMPMLRLRWNATSHGLVERLERTIADSSGRPARPYRFVDTLAAMERRGSISAGMRQAGEDFRDRFAVAQLDPLRAFDLSRPRIGSWGRFPLGQRTRFTHRECARGGMARSPRRRWAQFRRRFMCMARPWLATVAEGMGARAGLEWAAGQPGGSLRDTYCLARCARSAFRQIPQLLIIYLQVDNSGSW